METNSFLDFSAFCEGSSAPFVHKKKSVDGKRMPYSAIVWMQFRKEQYGTMYFKTPFDQDSFEEVSLSDDERF